MLDDQAVELVVPDGANAPTVVLRGEIDVQFAAKLSTCFETALRARPSQIVIDMTELTFIDSTGLNPFVSAEKRLRENGGHLVISHPPPMARRVLEVSGLTEVFTIH